MERGSGIKNQMTISLGLGEWSSEVKACREKNWRALCYLFLMQTCGVCFFQCKPSCPLLLQSSQDEEPLILQMSWPSSPTSFPSMASGKGLWEQAPIGQRFPTPPLVQCKYLSVSYHLVGHGFLKECYEIDENFVLGILPWPIPPHYYNSRIKKDKGLIVKPV